MGDARSRAHARWHGKWQRVLPQNPGVRCFTGRKRLRNPPHCASEKEMRLFSPAPWLPPSWRIPARQSVRLRWAVHGYHCSWPVSPLCGQGFLYVCMPLCPVAISPTGGAGSTRYLHKSTMKTSMLSVYHAHRCGEYAKKRLAKNGALLLPCAIGVCARAFAGRPCVPAAAAALRDVASDICH